MKKLLLLPLLFLSITFSVKSQQLTIAKGLSMPYNSVVSQKLLLYINAFVKEKNKPFKDLKTLSSHNINANYLLIDAMKDVEFEGRDSTFYKPHLINILPINKSDFEVQIAFINNNDLKGVFSLLARKQGEKFVFESPLELNTAGCKVEKIGKITYHYPTDLDRKKAIHFNEKYLFYNKILKTEAEPIEFYAFKNLHDALKNLGVTYYKDYNGQQNNVLFSGEVNPNLNLNGYIHRQEGDEHDLFHDCVAKVLDRTKGYRPMNEGVAYLYGGYGGNVCYETEEIKKMLKDYAQANSNINWLDLYKRNVRLNTDKSSPLYFCYALNMLLAEKIAKEKGFSKVLELMSCGKRQKDEKNYLESLNIIIGVNENNYNAEIDLLIKTL
jgi:hypothetical protein